LILDRSRLTPEEVPAEQVRAACSATRPGVAQHPGLAHGAFIAERHQQEQLLGECRAGGRVAAFLAPTSPDQSGGQVARYPALETPART